MTRSPALIASKDFDFEQDIEIGITSDDARNDILEQLRTFAPKTDNRPHVVFVMRGRSATRWYYNESLGYEVQKDEYAENIPEALFRTCAALDWAVIIVYEGRMPEFSDIRPSYSDQYPGIVTEIDFTHTNAGLAALNMQVAAHFDKTWDSVSADPNWQAAFSYKGVEMYDQFEGLLDGLVPTLSASEVIKCTRWAAIFEYYQPVFVLGGRLDIKMALIQAARDTGVLSANVKLGIGEEMLAPFYFGDAEGNYSDRLSVDLHLIWGGKQNALLNRRLPGHPSKWTPVGRTRNDSFLKRAKTSNAPLKTYLGLDSEHKIIVYGANHRTFYARDAGDKNGVCCLSWPTYVAYLDALHRTAESHGNVTIVVKPHPADDVEAIVAYVETLPDSVRLVTNADGLHNAEILGDADIFVSSVTSMFSEALASDCVPVTIWSEEINFLYERNRQTMFSDIALPAEGPDAMVAVVKELLKSADTTPVLERLKGNLPVYFGATDGGNSQRAIRAIFDYLGQQDEYADVAAHVRALPLT